MRALLLLAVVACASPAPPPHAAPPPPPAPPHDAPPPIDAPAAIIAPIPIDAPTPIDAPIAIDAPPPVEAPAPKATPLKRATIGAHGCPTTFDANALECTKVQQVCHYPQGGCICMDYCAGGAAVRPRAPG